MRNPRSFFLLLLIFVSSSQWLVHCQDTVPSSATTTANPISSTPTAASMTASASSETATTSTVPASSTNITETSNSTTASPMTTKTATTPTTTTTAPPTTAAPPAPTAIVLRSLTTTSIEIGWNTTADFTYIVVTGPEDEHVRNWTVSSSTENVTGLIPGTTYKVQLYSLNAEGETIREGLSISNSTSTALASITAPEVSHVSTSSLNINWTNPNGSWDYIETKCSSDCKSVNITDHSITTAKFDGLTAGRRYEFGLTAWNGSLSGETVTLGDSTEPASVTNLSLSTPEEGTVLVTWSTSGDFEHINVSLLCGSTGFECGSAVIFNSSNSTSNTMFGNLTAGDHYTVFITVNSYGKNSEEKRASIGLKPAAVTNLTLAVSQEDTIRVTWSASGVYESIYLSLCAASNAECSEHKISTQSSPNYVKEFKRRTRGEKYTVAVVVNSNGMNSTSENRTVVLKPASVTNLSLSTPEEGTVLVTWSTSGEFQYTYVSLFCASTGSECDSASISNSNNSTSNNTMFENLAEGDNYTVVVMVNSYGKNSTEKSASIVLNPLQMSVFNASNPSGSDVELMWSNDAVWTHVTICCRGGDSQSRNCTDSTTVDYPKTNYTFSDLTYGDQFNCSSQVKSYGEPASDPQQFTDIVIPPTAPVGFNHSLSGNKITLRWTDGDGIRDNYFLTCSPSLVGCGRINVTSEDVELTVELMVVWGETYSFSLIAQSNGADSATETITDVEIDLIVPTGLIAEAVPDQNQTAIKLMWDELQNASFTNFKLTCQPNATNSSCPDENELIFSNTTRNHTVSNLTGGETYSFTLRTILNGRESEETSPVTRTTYPAPPLDLNTTNITARSADIIWTMTKGRYADPPYIYTIFELPNNTADIENTTDNYLLPLTGLKPDSSYTVEIKSRAALNTSLVTSKTVSFMTLEDVPGNVTDVMNEVDVNYTSVSWKQPCERNGYLQRYVVKILLGDSCISGRVIECNGSCSTSKPDADYNRVNIGDCAMNESSLTFAQDDEEVSGGELTGLKSYTNYTLVISSVNSLHVRNYTSSFTTEQSAPIGAPSLCLKSATSFALNVSWLPLSSDESSGVIVEYKLRYRAADDQDADAGHWNNSKTVLGNETSVEIDKLEPFTNYTVQIRAATKPDNFTLYGPWSSSQTFRTGEYFPEAPSSLTLVPTARNINVSWTPPSKPNGVILEYLIQYQLANGTNISVENTAMAVTLTEGINPYTLYTVWISARTTYNEANQLWGNRFSRNITTQQSAPSGRPQRLNVISFTNISIEISWVEPERSTHNGAIKGYLVTVTTNSDVPTNVYMNTIRNITRLLPFTEYRIQVRAYTVEGTRLDGPPANISQTTRASAPLPKAIPQEDVERYSDTAKATSPRELTFELPAVSNLFNETQGLIEHYQIVVLGGESETISPQAPVYSDFSSTPRLPTWRKWNDGKSEIYTPLKPEKISNPSRAKRSTSDTINLGKDEDCQNKGEDILCNGPLKPGLQYCIYARGWTAAGYIDSNCFVRAATPADPVPVIIGVVVPVILLILLAIIIFVLYKRGKLPCGKQDPEKVEMVSPAVWENPRPETPPPHPISLSEFIEHVNTMHKDQDFRFSNEYQRIRDLSPRHSTDCATQSHNTPKNRWVDILPFDHSRVKLLPTDEEDGSDYINANFMPGYSSQREYVATQGPLPGTMDHFWRMVWEQNTTMIVMLTQIVERGRRKCEQYWPEGIDEPAAYGDLIVTKRTESVLPEYTIRIFNVQNGDITRTVKQFFVSFWPDFGCPDKTTSLINLVQVVRSHLTPDTKGPALVHCSAGVGRTGTYIAVDRLLQRIQEHDEIDVFNLVVQMREHRCRMVQTEDQYIYIHDCVRDALMSNMTRRFRPVSDDQSEPIYENTALVDDEGKAANGNVGSEEIAPQNVNIEVHDTHVAESNF